MDAIIERLNSAAAAFLRFAVPMLVQSGVLILILLLVDLALRKRVRAVFRYWIWLLVLAKLVLPSSLSSPLSLGYFLGDELAEIKISEAGIEEEPFDWRMIRPAPPLKVPEEFDLGMGTTTGTELPIAPVESGVAEEFPKIVTSPVTQVSVTWQGAVFLVWAAVVAMMGLLLLQRAMFVRGLVAQAKEPNRLMKETLEFCRGQMAVKGKVRLKVSTNAASPAVCGLFRPVILVPANLGRLLGSRDLRAVFLHELAHIKRGDLWVNLAQTVFQIVYFYNPLLWFANAMIRRVREQAVDEMVLVAMGERAKSYPETLVNVAKLAFKQPTLSLRLIGVVESKNALAGRIKRILTRPLPKSAKLGVLGLIVVLAIGCGLLPMAKVEKADVGVEVFSSNSLYQKQGSIRYALEFVGMPEELIDTTVVSKHGQLANPQQLEFANKLFSVSKNKDVDAFISLLSDGTKEQLNDGNNRRMLHNHIKEIKEGTFLRGQYDFKFFATFREFTEKDWNTLKKHVSFPETPTHAIVYYYFSKSVLLGSTVYLIEDEGSYKIVTQTLLSDPIIPVKKEQPTGPKEYGIVAFKETDSAYAQPTVWKYEWNIELKPDVSENNTFQILKTTKVVSGQADLHPEIAAQKIIDESMIEKYKYDTLKCRFYVGNSEPRYNYHKYGRKLSGWSCGLSIANIGKFLTMLFPGENITNVKLNKQGNFIGSDLELLSFETSEENIRYEHKVILRKSDSPEAKSAALLRLEQMTRRRISNKKLQYLNRILTTYANDHNSKYPDRLEQIKPYDTDEWLDWLLENIEYLGKGKTLTETSNTVLAYDKTLLGKAGSTNVLFNGDHVQYCNPNWLKKLGITGNQKPTVAVGVEKVKPARECNVVGRVLDHQDGKPIGGAKVKLWSDWTRLTRAALTRKDGTYRFDDVEPGPHLLRLADQPAGLWTEGVMVFVTDDAQRRQRKTRLFRTGREGGYLLTEVGPDELPAGKHSFEAALITPDDDAQQLDLYQQLPQSISGTVREESTRKPVADATISFPSGGKPWRSVRTDSEGRYRLYVPPRTIPLHCEGTAEQFCPVEMGDRHIRVGQGEHVENIDFLVRSAPSFTGQVVFADGSKAPEGVEVRAYLHWRDKRPREGAIIGCMMAWTEVQYMKTDESGAFMGYFRVPDHLQDSESYEVLVTACVRTPDGSKGGAWSVTTEAANPNVGEMKIVLEKTGSAEFRVVGPDGQGVTGLEVICEHWVKVNDGLRATVTEIGGGRYRAGRLIPGLEYRCWVQAKDYRQEYIRTIKPIVVRPGQHVQAPDIELEWWGKKVGIPYDLGRTGSDATEAVPTLLEVLKKSTDETAICRTAEALGQIGVASKPVIKALVDLLENKKGSAANAAAEALGRLGAVEAVGPIQAALSQGRIRPQTATIALWRIKKAANAKPIAAVVRLAAPVGRVVHNAWDMAEVFVEAVAAGWLTDADKSKPNALRDQLRDSDVKIVKVYADRWEAVAVTSSIKSEAEGDDRYLFLRIMRKSMAPWKVTSFEIKTAHEADRQLKAFLKERIQARRIDSDGNTIIEWGEPVEGLAVRLRPGKQIIANKKQDELRLDLRNDRSEMFPGSALYDSVWLEVDGRWYRPRVSSGTIPALDIKPGGTAEPFRKFALQTGVNEFWNGGFSGVTPPPNMSAYDKLVQMELPLVPLWERLQTKADGS